MSPIYEYYCTCTDETWDAVYNIKDRHTEKCTDCGKKAEIAMSVGAKPVIMEYYSENLQAQVTGPAHRRALMKLKGVEET